IVPTVLSTLAWQWMFDATFSVFNWMLMNAGIISRRILWLGDGTMAMGCLILVNVWRGMPFFAITLLAGLQTVNPDLHEAAEIAMRAAKLGQGASISLFLFPFLLMVIVFQLWYIRRGD